MPLATKVSPFNAPNYDVFTPARRSDDRGVVMGAPLEGGHNYVPWIGLSTVRELALKHADKVGLVEREHLATATTINDDLTQEVVLLRARVAELEANAERIAGLASSGYKVVRVQGRPKTKVEE